MKKKPALVSTKLRGIRQSDVEVKLNEGEFYTSADKILKKSDIKGAPILAQARKQIRRSQVKQEATIRQGFREAVNEMARLWSEAHKSRLSNGLLPAHAAGELEKAADRLADKAIASARATIERSVTMAVVKELRAQMKHLSSSSVRAPSGAFLARIRDAVVKDAFSRPWPGTKFSTEDRLNAIRGRVKDKLMRIAIARSVGEAKEAVGVARKALHDTSPGTTVVAGGGGSSSKSVQRINRSEQARAIKNASLQLFGKSGVPFAYWRLSPLHPWYGGDEVCERISAEWGPDVEETLYGLGLDTGSVELAGLYTIAKYPDVPHPNCMCYPEPLVVR